MRAVDARQGEFCCQYFSGQFWYIYCHFPFIRYGGVVTQKPKKNVRGEESLPTGFKSRPWEKKKSAAPPVPKPAYGSNSSVGGGVSSIRNRFEKNSGSASKGPKKIGKLDVANWQKKPQQYNTLADGHLAESDARVMAGKAKGNSTTRWIWRLYSIYFCITNSIPCVIIYYFFYFSWLWGWCIMAESKSRWRW